MNLSQKKTSIYSSINQTITSSFCVYLFLHLPSLKSLALSKNMPAFFALSDPKRKLIIQSRNFYFQLVTLLVLCTSLMGQSIPHYENHTTQKIAKDLSDKKIRSSRAAWQYSYIGKDSLALETWPNQVEDRWGFDTLTNEQLTEFRTFFPVPAQEYLLKRAALEQIMIINEAHHVPLHRHFLEGLLPALSEAGYKYFGLEALSNCDFFPKGFCDTLLNERGFPLNSPISGTYTREPRMANLIRMAHQLGFELFAYEQFGEDRELNQAKNIEKIIAKDPNAKILILCGFGHLIEHIDPETPYSNGKIMAYHLKERTGIDPFTVNQAILTEAKLAAEVPLYQMINQPIPSVFINDQGKPFNGWKTPQLFDVLVFHPRSQFIFGRPTWLINKKGHVLYPLNTQKITIDFPIIVEARYTIEPSGAVPVDVIELASQEDDTRLVLPKGLFTIKVSNEQGQLQEFTIDSNK